MKQNNVFRLPIKGISYKVKGIIGGMKVTCKLMYHNPITDKDERVKASARCIYNEYNYEIAKRIAESRCKVAMYKRYVKFIKQISEKVIHKHLELASVEVDHTDDIIQYQINKINNVK